VSNVSKKVRRIKTRMLRGESKQSAVYNEAAQNLSKVPRRNPGETEQAYYQRLIRKIYPLGANTRFDSHFRTLRYKLRAISREKKARQIFGNPKNRAGFIIIKPEFVPFKSTLVRTLRDMGCEVLFSKVHQLSGTQVWMYLQKYVKEFPEIVTESAIQSNCPSGVIVVRYPHAQKLIEWCKQRGIKLDDRAMHFLKSGDYTAFFSKYLKGKMGTPEKGTIRHDVVKPKIQELGFETMTADARKFDLGTHFKEKIPKGLNIHQVFAGVHASDDIADIVTEATIFLEPKDLKTIEKRLATHQTH
jgi:hypothetical protein